MIEGTRTCPRWAQALSIYGILTMLILLAACNKWTFPVSFNSADLIAISFPSAVPPEEAVNLLDKHGIKTIVSEGDVLVPMTDFVRLEYLSIAELSRRVQAGDPRHTPLTELLVSSFSTTGANGSWRIWYVPEDSNTVYKGIQEAFTEIGCDWAWDAQPPSPALRFLWVVWLGWIVLLIRSKLVKNRLYHIVLIAAWVPFAFFQSISAAAIMVVGQGISAILGMHALAAGRKQRIGRGSIHKLFVDIAPFLLSMLFLVSIDLNLLLPTIASASVLVVLVVSKDSFLNLFEKRRMHRNPPFRLIVDEGLRAKAVKLGIWIIVPLVIFCIFIFVVPFPLGDPTAYRLVYNSNFGQRPSTLDSTSMIRSHIVYQEALAWGRLGDANWMADSYTRPYRFELLDDRIVRGVVEPRKDTDGFQNSNELDKWLESIMDHIRGGIPSLVSGADIPRIRTIQLDSQGVVFYIMALASFCVFGLHRVSQSRRRMITSYINRQVA